MASTDILGIVLAGGEGCRLRPLTAEHAKPALPFSGDCRLIDIVLSNLVNSEISSIYVIAQYKPASLVSHIDRAWKQRPQADRCRVDVLLPPADGAAFRGTADAVARNLEIIERHRPDLVAVFAADHVYRMDIRQMAEFHLRSRAQVTVAAVPVPLRQASAFGVIVAEADGRIRDFQEKPERPAPMGTNPDQAFASMGNYLFAPEVLSDLLREAEAVHGTDFGRHVLPAAAGSHRSFAYDFSCNHVPGLLDCEERNYWRDVGTLQAYLAARGDTLGPAPAFSMANPAWPIRGSETPARVRQPAGHNTGFALT